MISEMIGRKNTVALLGNAASELAHYCEKSDDEEEIAKCFSKVCAYGMDLEFTVSREATQKVVQEVFEKMGPEKVDTLKKAILETMAENKEETQ